jgi:hypothetical protein
VKRYRSDASVSCQRVYPLGLFPCARSGDQQCRRHRHQRPASRIWEVQDDCSRDRSRCRSLDFFARNLAPTGPGSSSRTAPVSESLLTTTLSRPRPRGARQSSRPRARERKQRGEHSSVKEPSWTYLEFLRPILQMASQSARLSGEAAGEVSSMYSTPKSSSAWAIFILVWKEASEGPGKQARAQEEEEGRAVDTPSATKATGAAPRPDD